MYHQVLSWMYERPAWLYVLLLSAGLLAWGFFGYRFRTCRGWRGINVAAAVCAVALIACITVLFRQTQESRVVLSLAALLESARVYADVYIQMGLNAVLFFPLGLTLPFGVFSKCKHPVVWTVLTALTVSLVVETAQYVFSKGYAEAFDVVLNVTGAVIGMGGYGISRIVHVLYTYYNKKNACRE